MVDYQEFLENKRHSASMKGFEPTFMPDFLFDFQESMTEYAVRKGRAALFEDCGLGKTPQYLVWAQNIVEHTNKPVLILTPLAVSSQVVDEGEKFGVSCEQSRDGKFSGKIIVTNYERLHYFNSDDFIGVVCDECFPPETPINVFNIDNSLELRHIKDVKVNDKILNASGEDYVKQTYKRRINRAVRIKSESKTITSSENHPYYTLYGWRSAQDLQPGDYIMETETAVRLVRDGVLPEVCSKQARSVLRDILLSEMEDVSKGSFSESAQPRSSREKRRVKVGMVQERQPESKDRIRKNTELEPNVKPGNQEEGFQYIAEDEPQTFRAWGQWSRDDIASAINEGCSCRELDTGICYITGETSTRFSDMLQSRLRESRNENSNRGGRAHTPEQKGSRFKKRQKTGFARVDSVEVLESGHTELDKYRDENGHVYFYDIKATRHPSFSVEGLLVHNSSVLKNFDGKRKQDITWFMRKLPYRLLCTATAAPNDYIELGTASEALGEMGYMDMLNFFFKNDQNNSSVNRHYGKQTQWRFKKHAETAFWQWVSSWARALRKPSDLGFDDGPFMLPALVESQHEIKNTRPHPGKLFVEEAHGLKEQREELRMTLQERCEKTAEIATHDRPVVVWCHLNDEGDMLEKLIPGAVQVAGKHTDEQKEDRLTDFSKGNIRALVTKPKIAGFGLNWQHCSHMTFFPSHSYEQYYQAVRRLWRFGQKNSVRVDIVTTPGMQSVLSNLQRKSESADEMFTQLVRYMNDSIKIERKDHHTKKEDLPIWL